MEFLIYSILGVLSILIGIYLISYFENLKKSKKTGGFSFKLRTAGIGLIIIRIGLLVKAFK